MRSRGRHTVRSVQIDARKLTAEFLGTGFLVAGVVGSGIMAERLSDDVGLQLLENAFATAGVLLALILAFGPVSGAHFNPVVTAAERARGTVSTPEMVSYWVAQITGGIGTRPGLLLVQTSERIRAVVTMPAKAEVSQ